MKRLIHFHSPYISVKAALCLTLVFALLFPCFWGLAENEGTKAVGGVPAHSKNRTDNHDGTYTISLSVTGEAEKQTPKINVIVILDVSSSMNYVYSQTDSVEGTLYGTNSNSPNLRADSTDLFELTRRNDGTFWYRSGNNWQQYAGQRYVRDTNTRLVNTRAALDNLSQSLLSYNTNTNPDSVQMALVTFARTATKQTFNGSDYTTDYSTYSGRVNSVGTASGTNWQAALTTADGVNFGDDDPTFVIFFSDGSPTRYAMNGNSGSGTEFDAQNVLNCYNAAVGPAQTLAGHVGPNNFYTVFAYGGSIGEGYMSQLTAAAGAPAANNYSANDESSLNAAFENILAKIEMAGFGNVSISDGTTANVTTSSGVANLLVVEESYHYYRAGGLNEDGTEKYSSTANEGLGEEWTDAPEAHLVNSAVNWDLSELGVLENDVTYTVTFDVYPSQYTYDTIAKLKNGDITYASLDSEVRKYIIDNGDGTYSLETNTGATLSYDDTRDEEGQQTATYINPPAVPTKSSTLTATKQWQGESPRPSEATGFEITVLMNDAPFHSAEIGPGTNWSTTSQISVGIIKNGQVLEGAPGHDFRFAELDNDLYRWEIVSPTVHPMLIGGEVKMLVKADDFYPVPSGATTYTIGGVTYYLDTTIAGLTAKNYRRSNLDLTKQVISTISGSTGTAETDELFTFDLTVTAVTPDGGTEDFWFSIQDADGNTVMDQSLVTGATPEDGNTGYYYATSGSTATVKLKTGWNLRVTNLLSGSTYSITEHAPTDPYAFDSITPTATGREEGITPTPATVNGLTATGTIDKPYCDYKVTYTNKTPTVDVYATKVWQNVDGTANAPTDAQVVFGLYRNNETDPIRTLTLDGTPDDDQTVNILESIAWRADFKNLPKFDENNHEITYTIKEISCVPAEYYPTSEDAVQSGGTITNTSKTLTVSKQVAGNLGSKDKEFPFTLTMANMAGKTIKYSVDGGDRQDITFDASGVTPTFNLRHGQSITFYGIIGDYTVTETDNFGYTTEYKIDNAATATTGTAAAGTFQSAQTTATVEFTNTLEVTPPTGIHDSIAFALICLCAAAGLMAVVCLGRGRKRYD